MEIEERDLRAVVQLWEDLAAFAAAHVDEALRHALAELARLLSARNAFWIGAVRAKCCDPSDVLSGWRPQLVVRLHSDEQDERLASLLYRDFRADRIDPQTRAIVSLAGTTRAFMRAELVSDDEWQNSSLYRDVLQQRGIEDRLLGAQAVSPVAESYIGLDRGPDEPPFGRRERDLLYLFLLSAYNFHRELLRSYGLIQAAAPPSPRERDALLLLLAGLPEREIAAALAIRPSTAHQHIASLLRKFNVRGRQGLLALWLRQPGSTNQGMADMRALLVPLR